MPYKDPKAITEAGTATGVKKARLAPNKALLAGFLAGAYIGFGGLLAITVSSGLDPERWGTLPTLFTGRGLHRRPDARGDRRLRAADRQHGARPARAHAAARSKVKDLIGNFTWVARSATCSARCSSPTSSASRPAC